MRTWEKINAIQLLIGVMSVLKHCGRGGVTEHENLRGILSVRASTVPLWLLL